MNIFLVGLPGSGKTTIGLQLSGSLGIPFFDTDFLIEENNKTTIKQLFKTKGEAFFRNEENQLLQNWDIEQSVVATGGGMPCDPRNIELMKKNGTLIYLDCPIEVIISRMTNTEKRKRPKLKEKTETMLLSYLEQLYIERQPYYNQAHFTIDSQQSVKEIVELISKQLLL
ncbi:MAG: shikimate kinase [Saprospiraceae bacterium]